MDKALEKLDMSMKKLTLDLVKYKEDGIRYHQTLKSIFQQYQACKTLLDLAKDDINNPYFFKYADMDEIETLLSNAGYLEQPKKHTSR